MAGTAETVGALELPSLKLEAIPNEGIFNERAILDIGASQGVMSVETRGGLKRTGGENNWSEKRSSWVGQSNQWCLQRTPLGAGSEATSGARH